MSRDEVAPPSGPRDANRDGSRFEVEERVRFESLIIDLAAGFVSIDPERVDQAIEECLRRIVRALGLDRSPPFQRSGEDLVATHSWAVPGRDAFPKVWARADLPWSFVRVMRGEPVIFSRLDDPPEEAAADKALIRRFGPKANVTMPLVADREVLGALAFGSMGTERTWAPAVLDRLGTVTHMVCSVLTRRHVDRQLRAALAEVQQLRERLECENKVLRQQTRSAIGTRRIVGQGRAIQRTLSLVERVAPTDAAVLIMGETGVGKELVAEAIHARSARAERPMVKLNCAALPATLVEADLFGRETGRRTRACCPARSDASISPTARPSSWTKSASSPSTSRRSCCASCRKARSSGSEARGRLRCVWLPRRGRLRGGRTRPGRPVSRDLGRSAPARGPPPVARLRAAARSGGDLAGGAGLGLPVRRRDARARVGREAPSQRRHFAHVGSALTTKGVGMQINIVKEQRGARFVIGVAGLWAIVGLAGCTTTQQVKVADKPQVYCPFLGNDVCSKLTSNATPGRFSAAAVGGGGVMGLRYLNPDARWTQYKKVIIAPVSFWGGDDTSVSKADQLALTNYFTKALNDALSQKFQVVDQPGPGVMEVQVAIDDIGKAVPVLRTVSMLIPQARALATLKYAATGTYAFVGSAQAEGKVVDSVTGQVLAAGVDKRVGGGSIKTAAQWQLGDAENAMKAWSQQLADRLSSWTSGTAPS